MCFDLDSAPPIPVISGAAVSHDDLVLDARDGNRFAAFLATPDEPARVGVVILPDVRGLYCTSDAFLTVRPGDRHGSRLDVRPGAKQPRREAEPIEDAVIISGGDRLKLLRKRIAESRGRIDPATAMRIMLRPVSKENNLHNVLFAPQTLEMWVAHAASDPGARNHQACFQPYQRYDVRALLRLLPAPRADRGD